MGLIGLTSPNRKSITLFEIAYLTLPHLKGAHITFSASNKEAIP